MAIRKQRDVNDKERFQLMPEFMFFDSAAFLGRVGVAKAVVYLKEKDAVFSRGDHADTVFYIQKGQVSLNVISNNSKKAIIAQLAVGDFIGEECIEPDRPTRMATATALTECTVLRIDRKDMLRALHREPAFSGLFVSCLLARGARLEADLAE
jgi:CRP/FNR family cyclic AMP-dependent transcriptional regulator